jgi:hypothetical protein
MFTRVHGSDRIKKQKGPVDFVRRFLIRNFYIHHQVMKRFLSTQRSKYHFEKLIAKLKDELEDRELPQDLDELYYNYLDGNAGTRFRHFMKWYGRSEDGHRSIDYILYLGKEAIEAFDLYFSEPTFAHASGLLGVLGCSVALDKMTKRPAVKAINPKRPNKVARRSGGAGKNEHDIYRVWSRTDVLHDIYHLGDHRKQTADFIMQDCALKDTEKRKLSITFEKKDRTLPFTKHIMAAWVVQQDIDTACFREGLVKHDQKFDHQTRTVSTDINLRKKQAIHLTEMFDSWASSPHAYIMLDGLFKSLSLDDDNRGTLHESLLTCAYIQSILYHGVVLRKQNLSVLLPGRQQAFTEITFIDGSFNDVDNLLMAPFLNSWINNIKADCALNVVDCAFIYQRPHYIKDYWPDVKIDASKRKLCLESGSCFEFGGSPNKLLRKSVDEFIKHPDKGLDACLMYVDTFELPYTKTDLRKMFELWAHVKDGDNKILIELQLKRIMDVNLFRDLYKIDIAIQNGFHFITKDRLAFAMYVLMCEMNGIDAEHQALYLYCNEFETEYSTVKM